MYTYIYSYYCNIYIYQYTLQLYPMVHLSYDSETCQTCQAVIAFKGGQEGDDEEDEDCCDREAEIGNFT